MIVHRYAALLGARPAQAEQARAAAGPLGLEILADRPGLLFLGEAEGSIASIAGGRGVLWGRLFRRGSPMAIAPDFAADLNSDAIVTLLNNSYWGSFVAIVENGPQPVLFRDASGAMPAYHAALATGRILTSDVRMIAALTGHSPGINWDAVATGLRFRDARTSATMLEGVEELLPGMALTLDRAQPKPRLIWNPATYMAPRTGRLAEAAEIVRDAVLLGIAGLSSGYDHPLLELSGGVDSSIVAAGLAVAARRASCVSFEGSGADLNESRYANAVATRFGFPLEIVQPDPAAIDVTRSAASHLPRPNARHFLQATDAISRAAARDRDCDAFVNGGGGDDIFCSLTTVAPVLDRWQAQGWRGLLAGARDLARLREVSPWEALRRTVVRRLRPRPIRQGIDTPELLAPALQSLPRPDEHPWLTASRAMPVGRQGHLVGILRIQNYLEGRDTRKDAPVLMPLLSQPVMEACLGVPSWLWCADGINRAVARAAFANLLPALVIERTSKGGFDAFSARALAHSRAHAREMLLDGHLARHGLLDRPTVARCFEEGVPMRGAISTQLLTLIDTEAWVRSWHAAP